MPEHQHPTLASENLFHDSLGRDPATGAFVQTAERSDGVEVIDPERLILHAGTRAVDSHPSFQPAPVTQTHNLARHGGDDWIFEEGGPHHSAEAGNKYTPPTLKEINRPHNPLAHKTALRPPTNSTTAPQARHPLPSEDSQQLLAPKPPKRRHIFGGRRHREEPTGNSDHDAFWDKIA